MSLPQVLKNLLQDMKDSALTKTQFVDNQIGIVNNVLVLNNVPSVHVLSCVEMITESHVKGLSIECLIDSFTRDDVYALFKNLSHLRSLETITLSNCKLKDPDLEMVAKAIEDNFLEGVSSSDLL